MEEDCAGRRRGEERGATGVKERESKEERERKMESGTKTDRHSGRQTDRTANRDRLTNMHSLRMDYHVENYNRGTEVMVCRKESEKVTHT